MELQGQYSVFAVGEDNKIVTKPVTIAEKSGDMVVIGEGLGPNDVIVIDAIQKVSSGAEIVPELTTFESKTNH
jgi:multidrug efflux pump subunit AcrA (membrane-fusion protein)